MKLFIASALLAMSTPAFADTRFEAQKWEIAYQVLNVIDAGQTAYCLHKDTCEEANPIWGKRPSTATVIGGKLAWGAVHYALFRYILHRDPKLALRGAQVSVGLQGAVVLINMRVAF